MKTTHLKMTGLFLLVMFLLIAALPVAAQAPGDEVRAALAEEGLDPGEIEQSADNHGAAPDSAALESEQPFFESTSRVPGFYVARDNRNLDPDTYSVVGGHQSFYWDELEPSNDSYQFWRIRNFVEAEAEKGKQAAIGLITFNGRANEGNASDPPIRTPQWVFDAGAQKIVLSPTFAIPKYWDAIYLANYRDFVADLADYIEGDAFLREHLEFVQVGVGKFGESQPCDDQDDGAMAAAGLTGQMWADTVIEITDMYADNFQEVTVVLPSSPTYQGEQYRRLWNEFCVQRGVGIFPAGVYPDLEWVDLRTKSGWNGVGKYDHLMQQMETGEPMSGYAPVASAYEMYGYMTGNPVDFFWGVASTVARRVDYITMERSVLYHGTDWGDPIDENIAIMRWAQPYMGKDMSNAPSVWTLMRESGHANNVYPHKGNYSFGLTQDNSISGGRTVAVTYRTREELVNGWLRSSWDLYDNPNVTTVTEDSSLSMLRNPDDDPLPGEPVDSYPSRKGYIARRTDGSSNRYMFMKVHDSYMYGGTNDVTITVHYFDHGTDTWTLTYDAPGNAYKVAGTITKTNSNRWETATFRVTDAQFLNMQLGGADLRIDSNGDGDEYIHMVDVRRNGGNPAQTYNVTLTASNGGWNYISFPLVPTSTDAASVLNSIAGKYDVVQVFSNGSWVSYPDGGLTNIDHKMGMWIHMTQNATLAVQGQPPSSTTIPLKAGWNMIGWPSDDARAIATALTGIAGNYDAVYTYVATDSADPWKLYDPSAPEYANDLTQFAPGKAYWVYVYSDCNLTVDY